MTLDTHGGSPGRRNYTCGPAPANPIRRPTKTAPLFGGRGPILSRVREVPGATVTLNGVSCLFSPASWRLSWPSSWQAFSPFSRLSSSLPLRHRRQLAPAWERVGLEPRSARILRLRKPASPVPLPLLLPLQNL